MPLSIDILVVLSYDPGLSNRKGWFHIGCPWQVCHLKVGEALELASMLGDLLHPEQLCSPRTEPFGLCAIDVW